MKNKMMSNSPLMALGTWFLWTIFANISVIKLSVVGAILFTMPSTTSTCITALMGVRHMRMGRASPTDHG
jgi:hypothetical protein